ncbi:MAG: hypothetical protein WCE96_10415 [Nitrososphaeraceae archaeon]
MNIYHLGILENFNSKHESIFTMNVALDVFFPIRPAVIITMVTISLLSLLIVLSINNESIFAQQGQALNYSSSDRSDDFNANRSILQHPNESFNAEGTIDTVIFDHVLPNQGTIKNDSQQNLNVNISAKYVLGGKWRLDVANETVTYFKSNITMITTEGQQQHFHLIVYKPQKPSPLGISLLTSNTDKGGNFYFNSENNTLSFLGSADVTTNSGLEWKGIPITVSMYGNNVLKIYLDKIATHNHFFGKPIYGIVDSIEPMSISADNSGNEPSYSDLYVKHLKGLESILYIQVKYS